ncbi:DUF2892 domain-containing protein [Bacillus lacus]|uniref:DUF2892 domain-containing protein n=1 Tax=Metabacillus lacus TaxID=1983721 RepID=A0A7X2IZH4_9BACI|nr:DUF2892 domain-containing protein [Metabacillus lacus]MRX72662.1 DUF2892 domain-containing protein [Metabacillus lacus]
MLKPNIGIANSLIRITFGLTMLAWSTAKYTKNPFKDSYVFIMMMGAMKVGEGILRFCPMTYLFEKSNAKDYSNSGQHQTE